MLFSLSEASKPKKSLVKPEPVKADRSSEVEERLRTSVKDRLESIKVDSKAIIKEEAKKQAKDGKGKGATAAEKSEDMKLLEQVITYNNNVILKAPIP